MAILGDMGELGENEAQLHAEVGEHAAKCGIDVCICTGPLSANIAKMARKNLELIVIEEPDRDSLLSHLSDYVQTGDTILVKACGEGYGVEIFAGPGGTTSIIKLRRDFITLERKV